MVKEVVSSNLSECKALFVDQNPQTINKMETIFIYLRKVKVIQDKLFQINFALDIARTFCYESNYDR